MDILEQNPIHISSEGQLPTLWAEPVASGDPLQIQLESSEAYQDYSDWVEDGDFAKAGGWTIVSGSGMSVTGGKFTGTAAGIVNLHNSFTLLNGRKYKLSLTVESNNGTITAWSFPITKTGTFTYYFQAEITSNLAFSFATGGTYAIDNVQCYDITDDYAYRVYIVNASGAHQANLPTPRIDRRSLTYDVSFTGLSQPAKYQLKILDPAQNLNSQNFIPNGYFTNSQLSTDFAWVQSLSGSNTFVVTHNNTTSLPLLQWTNVTGNFTDSLLQADALKVGSTYDYSIEVESIVGSVSLVVSMGGVSGVTITTTGTHTGQITTSSSGVCALSFIAVGAGSMSVSQFSATMTDPDDYSPDYETNYMHVATSHCETVLLRAISDFDANGLYFGDSQFIPSKRVTGILASPEYPESAARYTDASGRRSIYSYMGRKQKSLKVDFAHEYVHDFLGSIAGFDNMYIDGTEYATEEEYAMSEETGFENYGTGLLTVSVRQQNKYASSPNPASTGIDASSAGDNLIDPQGNNMVDPQGNNIVIP